MASSSKGFFTFEIEESVEVNETLISQWTTAKPRLWRRPSPLIHVPSVASR